MNYVKLITNVVLVAIVGFMSLYLFNIINDPIVFEREKSARVDRVVDRLKNIREAQIAYRDLHGDFADNFEDLIHTMKYDSFPEIRIIGNPDDTAQVVIYDTTFYSMLDYTFPARRVNPDSLQIIPYSGGEKFNLSAGRITRNRVEISVFEASAPEYKYLRGLDNRFINRNYELRVGSMTEGNLSGNWE